MKTQISVFPWAKIGQNDHSNPYNIMRYLICGASKRIIIDLFLPNFQSMHSRYNIKTISIIIGASLSEAHVVRLTAEISVVSLSVCLSVDVRRLTYVWAKTNSPLSIAFSLPSELLLAF